MSLTKILIACTGVLVIHLQGMSQFQGPYNPGTRINDVSGGSIAWTNPDNGAISDNTYAIATNGITNYLSVSDFGFSIPANANITGIELEVERKASPANPVTSNTWTTFTPPAYTSGTATASYGSTSYSYNLPVSSATNNYRLLVVTIGIENADNVGTTNPLVTFGTVTYNGIAMTLATSNFRASATTSNNVAVYYLPESGLPATTGNRTLVINKTINGELAGGTISPGEYVEIVGVTTFTNVNQSTPVTAVSQTSATSPITSPPLTNVRNGDFVVAATMNNTSSAGGGSITQNTGYTENFEVSNNNTNGATSGALLEVQSRSLSGVTGAPAVMVNATAAAASRLVMGAICVNAARIYDKSTKSKNGAGLEVGNNKAVIPANSLPNAWPDTDTYQMYGGPSDLWGTTWTPADINSPDFGFSFQADAENSIASIDHVRTTVYYSVPLGVTCQSFTLTQVNEGIVSSFTTNIDDNKNYQFTLEKAGIDLNFKPVDSVLAINRNTIHNLSIADTKPYSGINYYRIRMNEENQTFSGYSSAQQIMFDREQINILVYPNPAHEHIVIESAQSITSAIISDITGKQSTLKITSIDTNKFKLENLPIKGIYTLIVNTNEGTISKRIIIN